MTWVIGFPTPFEYSILIADVQATIDFKNGKKDYHDIVQKIYAVGNYAMAGFSGDIENGFLFIQKLRNFMQPDKKRVDWIPDKLCREWGKEAKEIYANLPERKKTAFSMIIAAVSPQNINKKDQTSSFVAKLTAPNFEYSASRVFEPISIGSGNNKEEYIEQLRAIGEEPEKLLQMEVSNPYGYGSVIGVLLSYGVFRDPHPGVSRHLQMACITKKGYQIMPLNFNADIGLPHEQKIEMPELAKTWHDFDKKIKGFYGGTFSWAEALSTG